MRSLCLLVLAAGCGSASPPIEEGTTPPYPSLVAHLVDPFVGTAGEGNTFPGAVAPWGMVAPSPDNSYSTPVDYVRGQPLIASGYLRGAERIFGFGLTHLSGVGCPELGAPVIAATVGDVQPKREARGERYSDEVAWPGYYRVTLRGSGIRVELTAGARVALLRVRFPARPAGDANLLLDVGQPLSWGGGRGEVRVLSSSEVEGSSETGLFCARPSRQTVYFVARVSRPADRTGTWIDEKLGPAGAAAGRAGAFLRFRTGEAETVEAKVGISYVSSAGARRNLEAEPGGGGFEATRAATFSTWDQLLSRVRVSGGSEEARRLLYTGLYHVLIHPSLFADVDGQHPRLRPLATNPPTDAPLARAPGYQRHHVFSMWDTYRNVHPLLTLLFPERQRDLLRSLEEMSAESSVPPLWELGGNEVNMMIGDPVIPVIVDAHQKALAVKDPEALYQRLRAAALDTAGSPPLRRPGNASYRSLGYVPIEEAKEVWGPVSTTLEYAYADWALSRYAAALGHADDAALFLEGSRSWRKLLDPETHLFRPRDRGGAWLSPFDPDALEGSRGHSRSGGPGFVEGTAWSWAFAVPHDLDGLAEAHAGALPGQLGRMFDEGKFVMWNEPDLAFPYLFARLGIAGRTDREVHRAIGKHFRLAPDGLPGNDDAGTLSAWLVLSAIGLYPDCPGEPRYTLTAPLVDRVELQLDSSLYRAGRFVVEASRSGPGDLYIRELTLDGAVLPRPELTQKQLAGAKLLRMTLSSSPPSR